MNNINIGATPQKKKITIATGPTASRPRSSVVDNKIQPATKVRNTQKSASINNDVSILDMARPTGPKHGINQSTGNKAKVNVSANPRAKLPLYTGGMRHKMFPKLKIKSNLKPLTKLPPTPVRATGNEPSANGKYTAGPNKGKYVPSPASRVNSPGYDGLGR